MRFKTSVRLAFLTTLVLVAVASSSAGQGWTFDARRIALGGTGGAENLGSQMIAERREYKVLVLPFGLIQVLQDIDVLKPTSDSFDLIRTIEYAAAPLHYVIGRGETSSGQLFVSDIRNATLSRDLNRYRGFKLTNQPVAEGLSSPNWGYTFTVRGDKSSWPFHGIYVGAGPYLAMRTEASIDQKLVDLLASDTNIYFRNDRFLTSNTSRGEIALAGIVGYRGQCRTQTADGDCGFVPIQSDRVTFVFVCFVAGGRACAIVSARISRAPACFNTLPQASSVAPVVLTSSTSTITCPSIRLDHAARGRRGDRVKAARTLERRSRAERPDWESVARVRQRAWTIGWSSHRARSAA
jgi:hypothetical protein